jgi:hypothetical protein
MVRGGVRTQWLVRDHGMPAGDIVLASHALRAGFKGDRFATPEE